MTEQIKSAIEHLDIIKGVFKDDSDFKLAIRSLQAWGEVLQELENRYNGNDDTAGTFTIGIAECIDIIKQKLNEVKNEQSK